MPWQPLESVTVTTIGNVPSSVGVPESTPAVDSDRPAGSVLAVVNVAVPIAPLWVNVSLKGEPAVPFAFAGLLTVIDCHAMTSVYVALVPVQPLASVTLTVIGNEPGWPGVPESVPFVARVRPDGSVPLASV